MRTSPPALAGPQILVFGSAALLAAVWLYPPSHALQELAAYLPLHSFVEVVSIVIAALVFGVVWNADGGARSGNLMILACGLLAVALIDFAHMLSYAGMPAFVTPASPQKAIFFWLAARAVAAAALLAAAWREPQPLGSERSRYLLLAAALAIVAAAYWVGLYRDAWLPRMFVPGAGLTAYKVGAEYLLIAVFATAALLYYRRARAGAPDGILLGSASALSALSELCFSLYSDVTDVFNLLGHVFKIAAYALVYRAVFVGSVRAPFERLREREAALAGAQSALWESEAALRQAQQMARLAHVIVRADGSYERWSESWPRLMGLELSQVPRSTREALPLVHPDDRERFRAQAIEAGRAARTTVLEYRMLRGDGATVHIRQTMEPLLEPGAAGRSPWFVTLQDVTDQKLAEERIGRLNRVYAVLSGINAALIRVTGRQELFEEACRIAAEAGRFKIAWIGVADPKAGRVSVAASAGDVGDYFDGLPERILDIRPGARTLVAQALHEKRPAVSNDIRNDPERSNRPALLERNVNSIAALPLLVRGEPVGVLTLLATEAGFFDEEEMRLLLELAADIGFALDHIEKEEKVHYLAYYDPLTGLANRSLLLERLSQELSGAAREHHRLGLAIVNIERFKTINDTFGRHTGDALLRQIALRLTELTGNPSHVARVAPDHFAVIMPQVRTDEGLIARLEEGHRRLDGEPYVAEGRELRIATRAGVAIFPADGTDAEALFRNAESALKKAPSGEAFLFYTPKMTERVAERLTLENDLRFALERGEFVLYYQPKIDLPSRAVVGMEALIRWRSRDRGLVPPLEFIPLLEETGLILPVGVWALQRAALQHREWSEKGLHPPRVAVNVSAIQLRQREFVGALAQAIAGGVAPTAIDLEITESVVMEDMDANIDKLKAVRALGVNVIVDDFGTGYSSLGYLAKLPVQALKIDRSFVSAMADNSDAMNLVQTIISLGHSLRLKVIAEGVESEPQAKFLALMRCDEAQGYLFARPLDPAALEALLASSR